MHHLTQKDQAVLRTIADSKTALNYITKDVSPAMSLATTEAEDHFEQEICEYDRIYFVLEGVMNIEIEGEKVAIQPEDAFFIAKGTEYSMQGTFRAVVVNAPAFGSLATE